MPVWRAIVRKQRKEANSELPEFVLATAKGQLVSFDRSRSRHAAPPLLPDTFRLDARNCLDLVPPLVVLCLLSGIPSRFDGVDNLRLKESDRVEALRENLSPWADITFSSGSLRVVPTGTPVCGPVSFRSFMDHRIVMALNLFSAFVPVSFDNPEVVSKSYPAFWEQIGALVRKA